MASFSQYNVSSFFALLLRPSFVKIKDKSRILPAPYNDVWEWMLPSLSCGRHSSLDLCLFLISRDQFMGRRPPVSLPVKGPPFALRFSPLVSGSILNTILRFYIPVYIFPIGFAVSNPLRLKSFCYFATSVFKLCSRIMSVAQILILSPEPRRRVRTVAKTFFRFIRPHCHPQNFIWVMNCSPPGATYSS